MEVNLNLNGPERADLRRYLINRFSLVELKIMAADLGLDYDNFPHQTKEEFAPALIAYFEREKRLRELISFATEQRSDEKMAGLLSRPEIAPGQPPPYPRREQDTAPRQSYLRWLVDRIGRLSLAQINPEQSGGIYLKEVYVDSPTPLALSLELNNWQIVDWWLTRFDQPKSRQATAAEGKGTRYKPEELGYARPPFEALVSEMQSEIEEYHKKIPQAQPDG